MIANKKILLVEDDTNLGFVIKDNLKEQGALITLCKDGILGFEAFYEGSFDICVFDVMLPKKDGFSLASDVRKINKNIPIIFLTAKNMLEDKLIGYNIGADDYLTKPFAFDELLARINAVLKRSKKSSFIENSVKGIVIFKFGKTTFDYKNLNLVSNKKTTNLTAKEAELMRLLFIHKNNVLERDLALKLVWGKNDYFVGRSMDVFISRLRGYLSNDTTLKIENVHGIGFRLTCNKEE